MAGSSHADSTEFSKVESESKSLHALQVCVSKCLVCPTPAYLVPSQLSNFISKMIGYQSGQTGEEGFAANRPKPH